MPMPRPVPREVWINPPKLVVVPTTGETERISATHSHATQEGKGNSTAENGLTTGPPEAKPLAALH